MPKGLRAAKRQLNAGLQKAFHDNYVAGLETGANPDQIAYDLGIAVHNAIHNYVTEAIVYIPPFQQVGVAVVTGGTPTAHVGTGIGGTTAPHKGELT